MPSPSTVSLSLSSSHPLLLIALAMAHSSTTKPVPRHNETVLQQSSLFTLADALKSCRDHELPSPLPGIPIFPQSGVTGQTSYQHHVIANHPQLHSGAVVWQPEPFWLKRDFIYTEGENTWKGENVTSAPKHLNIHQKLIRYGSASFFHLCCKWDRPLKHIEVSGVGLWSLSRHKVGLT